MTSPRPNAMGFAEFVALMAAAMALQALAIDAMLSALPDMGRAFRVSDPNRLQWIVTAFIMGGGAGQLLFGPLSDWIGRRRVLLAGLLAYIAVSLLATSATSLGSMLVARFIQGVSSAASSVVPRSIVRDRYEGPMMARVLSVIFMVFLLVPIVAPSLGQLLLLVLPWRGIFDALGVAGALVWVWAALRLGETLDPRHERAPRLGALASAGWFVLSERLSICYTLASTLLFGSILSYVSTVPQIFAVTFLRPRLMAATFAVCAGGMGIAAFANSRLVERHGMRYISHRALLVMIGIALLHSIVALRGGESILSFTILQALTMACIGLAVGNFSAIAMQPMGAIAGSAASVQGVISMIGGGIVATLIGQQWSASVAFLPLGALCCGALALALVLIAERGVLMVDRS